MYGLFHQGLAHTWTLILKGWRLAFAVLTQLGMSRFSKGCYNSSSGEQLYLLPSSTRYNTSIQLLMLHHLQKKDHQQLKFKRCLTQRPYWWYFQSQPEDSAWQIQWLPVPFESCIGTGLNCGSQGASIPRPFTDLFQCNHLSFPLHRLQVTQDMRPS